MDNRLDQNPLWPGAVGALQSHFQAWSQAQAPRAGLGQKHPHEHPDGRDWRTLAADLDSLGIESATRDILLGWAGGRIAALHAATVRARLLHPMEREMLDAEAYGHLLDVYRLGLLDGDGLEQVLEQCAGLTRLPATLDQARALVRRTLADRIAAQGFGSAH